MTEEAALELEFSPQAVDFLMALALERVGKVVGGDAKGDAAEVEMEGVGTEGEAVLLGQGGLKIGVGEQFAGREEWGAAREDGS